MSFEAITRRPGMRLGRVLGVPVFLTPSWFLFAGFIVLSYGPRLSVDDPQRGYLAAAGFAVLLLASILLHEIGHCVVARSFGLPVRSITVTLLAGLTDIAEPPQTPAREYAVAVVGPMVSLLLAAVGVAMVPLFEVGSMARLLCQVVAIANGSVAVFNLLPGLPLDGGRVLRAALWGLSGNQVGSTVGAAWAGRVVAVLVVPAALLSLPSTGNGFGIGALLPAVLVAAFIFAGASANLRNARLSERLPGLQAGGLARPALRVPADLPLAEAVRRAHERGLRAIVVVDAAGSAEALVSEAAVAAVPEPRRPWVSVGTVARRLEAGLRLHPALNGEQLLAALRSTPGTEYLIADPASGEERVLVAADVAAGLSAAR